MSDAYAVTPENASPERCQEVLARYAAYLRELVDEAPLTPERAQKVRSSLRWCESTLTYWISFLLEQDGTTDPTTDDVRWQISELRAAYATTHKVPPIEAEALKLAKSHAKRSRAAARASVDRQQARSASSAAVGAPAATAPTSDAVSDLEAALATSFGITVEEMRAAMAEERETADA